MGRHREKVQMVVNYDNFHLAPDLADAYVTLVRRHAADCAMPHVPAGAHEFPDEFSQYGRAVMREPSSLAIAVHAAVQAMSTHDPPWRNSCTPIVLSFNTSDSE